MLLLLGHNFPFVYTLSYHIVAHEIDGHESRESNAFVQCLSYPKLRWEICTQFLQEGTKPDETSRAEAQ